MEEAGIVNQNAQLRDPWEFPVMSWAYQWPAEPMSPCLNPIQENTGLKYWKPIGATFISHLVGESCKAGEDWDGDCHLSRSVTVGLLLSLCLQLPSDSKFTR